MLNEMANECLGTQWVRAKGESAGALDRTQAVLFRLEIEVNAPVKRAEIRISAPALCQRGIRGVRPAQGRRAQPLF